MVQVEGAKVGHQVGGTGRVSNSVEEINLTRGRDADPKVMVVTEGVRHYRDLLRFAQPMQDPNASKGIKLELPNVPDPKVLFLEARGLSAWLRTQKDYLTADDAEFVRRSVPLYADKEKPFRTDTPFRDERIEAIDHRYGNGHLLEALTETEGLRHLMRIGKGKNKGREDMRDQATPVATILGLIAEKISDDELVVQAAERIVQASAVRLEGSNRLGNGKGEKERALAVGELTEAVKFLADVPLSDATYLILSVLHYAVDENLQGLRRVSVDALSTSMEYTKGKIGEDREALPEYRFSLHSLRAKIPYEAYYEQEVLTTLVRGLSVY